MPTAGRRCAKRLLPSQADKPTGSARVSIVLYYHQALSAAHYTTMRVDVPHPCLLAPQVYDSESGCWSEAAVANNVRPPTRVGHAAVAIGGHIVVIGGRSSPQACLGDVWLLDTHTLEWCQVRENGPGLGFAGLLRI